MRHGYARVSTVDQDPRLQVDALSSCDRLWSEKRSSWRARPELGRLLYSLRRGDEVIVWKVDRLARSLSDLLRIISTIERTGATFRSITEPIDTSTPIGRMLLHLLGVFAEFERSVIRERCQAGRIAARSRGVRFGRPRSIDRGLLCELLREGCSQSEAARRLGCSPSSVCHLVRSGLV
jgi:DNA invertase Pin-like site-specific DNA recombinase